jgi:hypothetical protein
MSSAFYGSFRHTLDCLQGAGRTQPKQKNFLSFSLAGLG